MEDIGPLSVLLELPTYVGAVVIYVATHMIKTAIDISMGGTAQRKLNPWMSQIGLPMIPLILGFLYGAFVPFHPEAITAYVESHEGSSMLLVGGMFGVVVGQFSDYLYGKITKGMKGFAAHSERKSVVPKAPSNGAS